MKNNLALFLAVGAMIVSAISLVQKLEAQKRAAKEAARQECRHQCERKLDAALFRIELDRLQTTSEGDQQSFVIRSNKAFNTFMECTNNCQQGSPPVPDFELPFDIPCIESRGFTCFKAVSELCQQVSGACGDCWQTLCPDQGWEFSSDTPMTVTLVAAAEPEKNPRTLAASTSKSKRVALSVPRNIKLENGEKLWLRFELAEKPANNSAKITLHWTKTKSSLR